MGDEIGQESVVTLQEMVLVQMFESEALLNFLKRKGLISKTEVLDEVRRLKAHAAEAR